MPVQHELHLGLDFGTSKIAVAWFSETSEEWEQLLQSDVGASVAHEYEKYVEPSQVTLLPGQVEPLFGRKAHEVAAQKPNEAIVVLSVKKCVYCEWVLQPACTSIQWNDCVNHANFRNSRWCIGGGLQFTLDRYDWRPSALFYMLLDYTFRKTRTALDNRFERKGYLISELKLAYPLVFSKAGREQEERLRTIVSGVARPILKDALASDFTVSVVEEPIASLMAFGGDNADATIENGFFIIVDIGAGSADFALCQKKGSRIIIHDSASAFLAGDNYDDALASLLQSKVGSLYDFDPSPRVAKERYCVSRKSVVVACLDKESRKIKRTVKLEPAEIERHFRELNDRIGMMAAKMKDLAEKQSRQVRNVYITGGGCGVGSLVEAIKGSTGVTKPVCVQLADPKANRSYDAGIVSVSMGAAFPRKRYTKILKYALPVNLVAKVGAIDHEKEVTLYRFSDSPEPTGVVEICDIPEGSRLRLFVEDGEGNRLILNSIQVPERCREGQIRYEVAFNGLTKVCFKPEGRRPWHHVFEGYPHWRFRKTAS